MYFVNILLKNAFTYIILLMKSGIHPTYHEKAKVTCSCGNSFEVGSTIAEIGVEICSKCHPFFTGQEKMLDTAGRIDKFKARQAKAATAIKTVKKPRVPKVEKAKKA